MYKKNYATKVINAYIVFDLDNWVINPVKNIVFKNCLIGVINIVKTSNKSKYVFSGCRRVFGGASS